MLCKLLRKGPMTPGKGNLDFLPLSSCVPIASMQCTIPRPGALSTTKEPFHSYRNPTGFLGQHCEKIGCISFLACQSQGICCLKARSYCPVRKRHLPWQASCRRSPEGKWAFWRWPTALHGCSGCTLERHGPGGFISRLFPAAAAVPSHACHCCAPHISIMVWLGVRDPHCLQSGVSECFLGVSPLCWVNFLQLNMKMNFHDMILMN